MPAFSVFPALTQFVIQQRGPNVSPRQVNRGLVNATAPLPRHVHRVYSHATVCRATETDARAVAADETTAASMKLLTWLVQEKNIPVQACEPQTIQENPMVLPRTGLVTTRDVPGGEVAFQMPGDLCITAVDAGKSAIAPIAEGRSDLVQLTLWLMYESSIGASSEHRLLLSSLPSATLSPLLWTKEERADLLQGSPLVKEIEARLDALHQEWYSVIEAASVAGVKLDEEHFTTEAFVRTFCVVLAHAIYLPSAECFALVPLLGWAKKTASSGACGVDYDPDTGSVIVVTDRMVRKGYEITVADGRPNAEMLLACGTVEAPNPADYLDWNVSLVAADRMYSMKKQIVEEQGFEAAQTFPVFEDRMPTQMLTFLRLSRVQEPGQLALISFKDDRIVSQLNEYEILQLLMGDCRERLAAYRSNTEDDLKMLQDPGLTGKERVACEMRLVEKRIINGFMDGVRRKLAPIRGIPTKGGGMQDPNADLVEIFDTIESIPKAPMKLFDGLKRWASGEDDPEWKRGKKK